MYTCGADPEVFLADAADSLVSVIDKIGGTKHNPRPLPLGEGFAVQEDNVACEYNIPPAASEEEFSSNIEKAMSFLQDFFKRQHGLKFINLSAAEFPADQLVDHRAQEFGCDPDFNAWTGRRNPRPKAASALLRSAGGHVHIGCDLKTNTDKRKLIRAMDFYVGVGSVLMDSGDLRKQLYGKAGAFRYKPFGVEYRTLSNFWVFDKKYCGWVWRNTGRALDAVQDMSFIDAERANILEAINNNNKAVAEQLVARYDLELV